MNRYIAAGIVAAGPALIVGLFAMATGSHEGGIVAVGVFAVVYLEILFGRRPE